jgi:ubiquinone/menaquinone biosynthesis C-methylase UbiE
MPTREEKVNVKCPIDKALMDYRVSHLDPPKGRLYEESFSRLPYRRIVWEWEKDVLNEIVQNFCKTGSSFRYLDFACGTGRILRLLENYMGESYGIDVSESMLSVAKEKIHHSHLIRRDLTKEDIFPDNYFDIITAFRFFLNAQQDLRESVLCAFRRILIKDGYLIVNIHMNRGCLLEKELRAYQFIRRIQNSNFQSISVNETIDLLIKHNFKLIHAFHYGILPVYREERKLVLKQIDKIERLCSRLPLLLPFSRYVIYFCRLTRKE